MLKMKNEKKIISILKITNENKVKEIKKNNRSNCKSNALHKFHTRSMNKNRENN